MKDSSGDTPHEEKERRCPKLGGPVTFDYCKLESSGLPCARAIHCWFELFDVESYFRNELSAEEFDRCFNAPPPSKIGSLMEIIEQAKKVATESRKKDD